MVLASFAFAGDSFALGVHWIYDTNKIKTDFGRVDSLRKTLPGSSHPTKEKDEFTHYGDQTFLLLESIAAERFKGFPLFTWVKEGIESGGKDSVSTIARFGQSCHTGDAFPGVVHLIAKYENNLKEALVQAVMAGGDGAGRGLMVGMVLGAHLGDKGLPKEWVSRLRRGADILKLLEQIEG
jgi:ADP-ribosylglycohydrolase